MPPAHPTRHVAVGDVSAEIDVEIAPLVEAVWRLGLRTLSSCQDDAWGRPRRGFVRLVFAAMDDGVRFLGAAGRDDVLGAAAPVLDAARQAATAGDGPSVREVHVLVAGASGARPWHLRVTPAAAARLDVFFPREQLAAVERAVRGRLGPAG